MPESADESLESLRRSQRKLSALLSQLPDDDPVRRKLERDWPPFRLTGDESPSALRNIAIAMMAGPDVADACARSRP